MLLHKSLHSDLPTTPVLPCVCVFCDKIVPSLHISCLFVSYLAFLFFVLLYFCWVCASEQDEIRSQHSVESRKFEPSGFRQFQHQDIAASFRDFIDHAPLPDEKEPAPRYNIPEQEVHEMDQDLPDDQRSLYDDDEYDEMPADAIVFSNSLMNVSAVQEVDTHERKQQQPQIEYYPATTILKQPDPATLASDIARQFEAAFDAELEQLLDQSAQTRYAQNRAARAMDEDDIPMAGGFAVNRNLTLRDFRNEELQKKENWEAYDLGWRNKAMSTALLMNGKLFSTLNKQYFKQDKVALFNEIGEINTIQHQCVITGLEKIFGKEWYLQLVDNLLRVHKKYYFDQKNAWSTTENGDKLQLLCDSYCQQVATISSYITVALSTQNNNQTPMDEAKWKLGKKILTKFYDALQLILALYAPRCGSGPQSNLNIPAKQIVIHEQYSQMDEDESMEEYGFGDDDEKRNARPSKHKRHDDGCPQISYNELFARRHNVSKWLERVIADEVDEELKRYQEEINKVNQGSFAALDNEDEKNEQDGGSDNDMYNGAASNQNRNKMSEVDKKKEIDRWIDEKIFTLLTANRKQEAAEQAIKNGDFRLATLIAQSPHFAAAKHKYQPFLDLRNQIDYWQHHKVWETFNDAKKKIYVLLAGRYLEVVDMHKFNWFRSMGILLWYYLPKHWHLNTCVVNYQKHCELDNFPFVEPNLTINTAINDIHKLQRQQQQEIMDRNPLSTVNTTSIFTKAEIKEKPPNDICFDLIRSKYAMVDAFDCLFNPRNMQPFKLEHLFNFFLHDLLFETQTIQSDDRNKHISHNICYSFIEQLERMGYWQWAIYVALFMHGNEKRREIEGVCNYHDVAFLILRRNINQPIPITQTRVNLNAQQTGLIDSLQRQQQMEVDENDGNAMNNMTVTYCQASEQFCNEYLKVYWGSLLDQTTIVGLKFLVHIGVEVDWIVYCLAEYAETTQDWLQAYRSYEKCAKWNKAHQLFMDYLFMNWFFDDELETLRNALLRLHRNREDIQEWEQHGMIIYEYIKLMSDVQKSCDRNIETNITRCKQIIHGLDYMLKEMEELDDGVQETDDQSSLQKRVCLLTMKQRLETCSIHLDHDLSH